VAVEHDVRGLVAVDERVAHVERRQLVPVDGVEHHEERRPHRPSQHRFQEAQAIEGTRRVGCQLESCAHLGELGRLLDEADAMAGARQREGGRQAADPAADDEQRHIDRRHPASSMFPQSRLRLFTPERIGHPAAARQGSRRVVSHACEAPIPRRDAPAGRPACG
jgi:hypothetical protein